jgi:hypothetical protein
MDYSTALGEIDLSISKSTDARMKKLTDIYKLLGQAFEEHRRYNNEGSGKTLVDNIVSAYSEDAIPLETTLLMINQLSYDYPPAKDLWTAMNKVRDRR